MAAMNTTSITKIQDDDGHWYWIPNGLIDKFKKDLNDISGLYYVDSPYEFDKFIENYDKYRTMGHPDNMPEFLKTYKDEKTGLGFESTKIKVEKQ